MTRLSMNTYSTSLIPAPPRLESSNITNLTGKLSQIAKNHSSTGLHRKITCPILGGLGIFVCVANGLILVAYLKYKQIQRQRNFLLANLAIADCLAGILLFFQVIIYSEAEWLPHYSKLLHRLHFASVHFPRGASMLAVVIISIDRYIGISKPLKVGMVMTNFRMRIVALICWIVAATHGIVAPVLLLYFTETRQNSKTSLPSGSSLTDLPPWYVLGITVPLWFICSVTLVVFHVKMFVAVKAHAKEYNWRTRTDSYPRPEGSRSMTLVRRSKRETGIKKMGTLVVGTFFLSWVPLIWFLIIESLLRLVWPNSTNIVTSLYPYGRYAEVLAISKSALNPFIYGYRSQIFKLAVRHMFCRSRDQRSPYVISGSVATLGITMAAYGRQLPVTREYSECAL